MRKEAAVLFTLAAAMACGGPSSDQRAAIDRMAEAVGRRRPFEARLTGFDRWHPCRPPAPGAAADGRCEPRPQPGSPSFAALQRAAPAAPDGGRPEPWPAGVWQLLWSSGRQQVAAAVDRLESAARRQPDDPDLLSDLGAARLALARAGGDAWHALTAVEPLHAALTLEPGHPGALFNLALALDELRLDAGAAAGWHRYLHRHPTSGAWAAEARRRLLARPAREPGRELESSLRQADDAAAEAVVAAQPQRARELAERTLLPGWARAVIDGDAATARDQLRLASLVADALAGRGDRLAAEAAAAARRAGTGEAAAELARAHLLLERGRQTLFDDLSGARTALEQAVEAFSAAGSPAEHRAAFYLAYCDYLDDRSERAAARLRRLLAAAPDDRYPTVAARAHRFLALLAGLAGEPLAALPHLERGLELYRGVGEAPNTAALETLAAGIHRLLGDTPRSWSLLFAAQGRLLAEGSVEARFQHLDEMAQAASQQGLLAAALFIQSELVALARRTGDPLLTGPALRSLAAIQLRLPGGEPPAATLHEARAECLRIGDPAVRSSALADLAVVSAWAKLERDPASAARELSGALESFRAASFALPLVETLVLRAHAHRRLGALDRAEADLEAAVAEIEAGRAALVGGEQRIRFLDRSRRVFDEAVDLLSKGDRPAAALAMAERGRARAMLDSLSDAAGAGPLAVDPSAAADLARRLPAATALVEYRVLSDRTLVWVTDRAGLHAGEIETGWRGLEAAVAELTSALAGGDAEERRRAARLLFDHLWRPVLALSPAASGWVVVPDGPLAGLPFAALEESADGRRLIELGTVSQAPSAAVFDLLSRRLERGDARPPRRLLAVGDPAPAADGAGLPPLPGAATEAREIAALYPDAVLLEGAGATADRLLTQGTGREVVHFAGHAVAHPDSAALSRLQLAPGGDGRGALLGGRVLAEADLTASRLVVLSACSTAAGRVSATEGTTSLATLFLAAGAPAVVATLWPIDDRAARPLFVELHRGLRRGLPPAEALRQAQLTMHRSPDPRLADPAAWAGVQLIGGLQPPAND